jgi:type IV pilus assembly protein PilM
VVTNFGMTPTPRHSIVEGVIVKPQDVAGAIRSLMSEIGLGHRRVVTAVGGQGVILRHAQFPRMSERELREVLRWEAEQHIPIPPGEAISDFSILEEVSPTDRDPKGAQKKMKVLLVATQQKVVNALLETLRVAGLYPVAVDVDAIAAYRVLTVNGYVPPSSRNLSTMLVDIGATTTKLSVFLDGVPQLTRTVPVAGNGLTAAVAEGLGQDMASAERSKREMGAMPDTPIARFLQPLLDELLLEVRRSIEFYLVRNYGQEINHIYLAGGGANLKGLPQALADYLNLSLAEHAEGEPDVCVQAVEPLREVELHPALNEQRVYLGPQFLVALGLALREEV